MRLLRILGKDDPDASEAMNDILAQVFKNIYYKFLLISLYPLTYILNETSHSFAVSSVYFWLILLLKKREINVYHDIQTHAQLIYSYNRNKVNPFGHT